MTSISRLLSGIGIFVATSIAICATAAEQPNIIFIISDDQRWDGMGIAGNPNVNTPNMDQMAREGQWFREATIQVPTCSASRSAILTGIPCNRNGWYSNNHQRGDILNSHGFDQYKVLPGQMQKAGYHTAMVGKWHISPDPWLVGFKTIKHWMIGGAGPYKNPRLAEGKSRDVKVVPGFTQTIFADDAIEVLQEAADDGSTEPLFLWLAFTAPHAAFKPNPEPFDGMYDGKSPEELVPPTFYDDPSKTLKSKETWRHYYEAISSLDHEIGRIMDTVRNSSLSTNTLVVFISDNGFMMGSRGMWGKYVPYEGALRVPMIVWGPGSIVGATGTTVTASANSLDLPPTFVKLAGGTPPAEWTGRDLSPVFKDGKPHDITWAVSEYPDHNSPMKHVKAYRVVRTPEHKLIKWHPEHDMQPELYNLSKDPDEGTNLYGKPEVADVQAKLENRLANYRDRVNDEQWDMKGPIKSLRQIRRENADEPPKGKRGKARGKGKRSAGRKKQAVLSPQ